MKRMISTLHHRGPDGDGVWVDQEAGIALGHKRLAILDVSPRGAQPFVSSCGTLVVVFNGEIYNHLELRKELEARGRRFVSTSDTEVLVEACAEWGIKSTLQRIVGMFAFAVWHKLTRTLSLARDHFGIKPLYWTMNSSSFLFASELKAISTHLGRAATVDPRSVAAFVRYRHVPAPYSIFHSVSKLEPGVLLTLPINGDPSIHRFWNASTIATECANNRLKLTEREAIDELEYLLSRSVRQQMMADVPAGSFLSSGIDSSLITALMQGQASGPIRTYSIGFAESDFDEAPHARAIAKSLGTDHTELYIGPNDVLEIIPELTACFDEPFAANSQIPTLMVSKLAKCDVTVVLSGDGGDELFGGYPRYYANLINGSETAIAGTSSWLEAASMENGLYRELISTPECFRRAVLAAEEHVYQHQNVMLNPAMPDYAERACLFDLVTSLPDDILAKVDRVSMSTSLEVRVPILDHRIAEFAWRLPSTLKFSHERDNKHLLRQLLYRFVPPDLSDHPKKSFVTPIGLWLRGPLRDWAEDLLDLTNLRAEPYFDAQLVRTYWQEHLLGQKNHHRFLWCVLMFQQWLRHHRGQLVD